MLIRMFTSLYQLFRDRGRYHIETNPLICSANQWTSFYMISAPVVKEFKVLKWESDEDIEAYLETCQTSIMERFFENSQVHLVINYIPPKYSIIDIWQGSISISDLCYFSKMHPMRRSK